jgi:hypothetical protein
MSIRRIIVAVIATVLLLAAYMAWPYFALHGLVDSVARRDATALASRINFADVRYSLADQIVREYLRETGKEARLGRLGSQIAIAAVVSAAEPIVGRLLSPQALLDLLDSGWPDAALPGRPATVQGLRAGSLGDFWEVLSASSWSIRRFAVGVPTGAAPERRFVLRFRLSNWEWRLVGIGLPQEVVQRAARELIKAIDGRKRNGALGGTQKLPA